MKSFFCCIVLFFTTAHTLSAQQWVQKPSLTYDANNKNWQVTFELDKLTDVEVSLVDSDTSTVVRHLAAGVLGPNPPAPLTPDSRAQKIIWDGKDDYGNQISNTKSLSVRVRAGLGVSLKQIVGGNPYAFFSKQMGQGDHAKWKITGLEAKPDGTVYVMGNSTYFGPPVIRRFDANGNYLRTVFPPPADKPAKSVQGWGIHLKDDNTYSLRYNDLSSPAPTTTFISGTRGAIANLFPTPDNDRLTLWNSVGSDFKWITIGTDGTLEKYQPTSLVKTPQIKDRLFGPFFSCQTPDKKYIYLSGIFSCENRYGSIKSVHTTGFWRDAQVWKVDTATGHAEVFFSLEESQVLGDLRSREKSPIASGKNSYSAFHGVAVDTENHVFVCDRQNKRIVILDSEGKLLRELPVAYPDAITLLPKTKSLYVTTRIGTYSNPGELRLVKFDDWTTDTQPSISLRIGPARDEYSRHHRSFVAACSTAEGVNVWVAYQKIPVRVYRDKGNEFQLIKDFYEAGPQRCLDFQRIMVDQKTEDVYVADGFGSCFRLTDWKDPRFVRCMLDDKTPLRASSLHIDSHKRLLYVCREEGHGHGPIVRYNIDGNYPTPAPVGDTKSNVLTQPICNDWRIGLGYADRGFAAAPTGSLAVLGGLNKGKPSGDLHFFKVDPAQVPWRPMRFDSFGSRRSGCVRFDTQGNLYVGVIDGTPKNIPAGFEKDANFANCVGRIYKYAPTGSPNQGDLFPSPPTAPAKIYDVHFGTISSRFCRTPRFSVDGFGRIYCPTTISQSIQVLDNAGNSILRFGTYGNRDSLGGLSGDLVPTRDIPLAYPNSVDATEDHIYVGDLVNIRLLQIEKTFRLDATSK